MKIEPGKYLILKFPQDAQRPQKAEIDERLELKLLDEEGEEVNMTVIVTYFEKVPGGCMIDAETTIMGRRFVMNIFIGSNSAMDFVKMWEYNFIDPRGPMKKQFRGLGES